MRREESGVKEQPEANTEARSKIQMLGTRKKQEDFVDFIVYVASYYSSLR